MLTERRDRHLLEHEVATLVGQRVFALALGYEDLNDHDQLRHDPIFAILASKLEARRADGARVRASVRRLYLAMASGCPYQSEFALAHIALRRAYDTG